MIKIIDIGLIIYLTDYLLMHLSCYKIKSYYYYLLPLLRRTSTVFPSCVTSKSYKSCTDITDIHLLVEASHLSSDLFHSHTFLFSPLPSRIVFFFPSHLSRSLSSFRAVCQVKRRQYARYCADPELRRSGNCVKFTVERYSIDCGVCI